MNNGRCKDKSVLTVVSFMLNSYCLEFIDVSLFIVYVVIYVERAGNEVELFSPKG